jgi:RNA polymerase sigma factor (sigma-70 family)
VTDELLVVRCQLGERQAIAELVRTWHGPVSAYVRRMLGPADEDDVSQEVWLAVLRGLPRLREPARFAPWLFIIARRAVLNRLRIAYTEPDPVEPPEEARAGPDCDDAVVDRTELVASVGLLPVREKEILVLFYLHDLSLEACAEVCGIPVGTVKSRLSRARRLLREELVRKGFQR